MITDERLSKWAPPAHKPSTEWSLLELWSKYGPAITKRRHLDKKTFAEYTTALNCIEDALKDRPAASMNAFDYWEAVHSNSTYAKGSKGNVMYKPPSYKTRFSAIHDILSFCEEIAICSNPLWITPWEALNKQESDYTCGTAQILDDLLEKAHELSSKKVCSLSRDVERKLISKAMENLFGDPTQRDGRWIGVLCYLYMGPRPSEGRGLRYRDFCTFEAYPDDWYCNLSHSAYEDGSVKARGKNRNSVRRIPVHPEFACLLKRWIKILEEEISKKDPSQKIDDLPLICLGSDFSAQCEDIQLTKFVKEELKKVINDEELKEIAVLEYALGDDYLSEENEDRKLTSFYQDLSTRIFRRNFITKMYAETLLDDSAIRAIVGHKNKHKDSTKYPLDKVHDWLQAMAHRMIMPELRNDYFTEINNKQGIYKIHGSYHKLILGALSAHAGKCIEISLLGLEPGGTLLAELSGSLPAGTTFEIEEAYFPNEYYIPHRVMSDYDQWDILENPPTTGE